MLAKNAAAEHAEVEPLIRADVGAPVSPPSAVLLWRTGEPAIPFQPGKTRIARMNTDSWPQKMQRAKSLLQETFRYRPSVNNIVLIAKVLGISASDLLKGVKG